MTGGADDPVQTETHPRATGAILEWLDGRYVRNGAKALGEPRPSSSGVSNVHLPVRVPRGFHGNWLPARHGRARRVRTRALLLT